MIYEKEREVNYDLSPVLDVEGITIIEGFKKIVAHLKAYLEKHPEKKVIVFDYYAGVHEELIFDKVIKQLGINKLINAYDARISEETVQERYHGFITDDRLNGVYSICNMKDFYIPEKVEEIRKAIAATDERVVLYGAGSAVITTGDVLIYSDISAQTVTERLSAGASNWQVDNSTEEPLRKAKRFVFLEQLMFKKHKRPIIKTMDFYIDSHFDEEGKPAMVTGDDFRKMLDEFNHNPYQMVPEILPGVWGGHWMQKVYGATPEARNTAWCRLVKEDGSLQARCDGKTIKFPFDDLMEYDPINTLGGQIYYFFGYHLPYALNILDTWGGQNLSLQVHPIASFSHEYFNWPFGHFESYYMLDTCENSSVYLGIKEDVTKDEVVKAFEEAQETGVFDDEKYINRFPMKRHDHVFIPSGTIHAEGKDTLVYEIDSTVYTTMKLWDWGRVDFDGKPRPINIGIGKENIQEFKTKFVEDNLISKHPEIARGDGYRIEKMGSNEYEVMTTRRLWLTKPYTLNSDHHIRVITLVEGEEAIIESPTGAFKPKVVHFGENTIIPPYLGDYTIRHYGLTEGQEIGVLDIVMDLGGERVIL